MRKQKDDVLEGGRHILGPHETGTATSRILKLSQALLLVGLIVLCLFPLWTLVKNSFSTTDDLALHPLALFPEKIVTSNLGVAWEQVKMGRALWNTLLVAIGSVLAQVIVGTMGGYALGVLKPRGYKIIYGLVLATLFVPSIVTLVPSYLIVVRPPWGGSMLNSMWAMWLPAGVSSFNVLLMARFFSGLSKEVMEAAEMDGANALRRFWSIVLPMSKPIVAVISILGFVGSMQGYMWPMLVLPDPSKQPLAVRLPGLDQYTDPPIYMAALLVAALVPIAVFLGFSKPFLSGEGLAGAVKG